MFERYSEQARRAIFFARVEAMLRASTSISPIHVFLGITWDESSRAVESMELKDKLNEFLAAAKVPLRPCSEISYTASLDLPLDNDSKKVLAYAAMEADRDWLFTIDTDHLLRGLLRFRNDVQRALGSLSIDLRKVRTASKQATNNHSKRRPDRRFFLGKFTANLKHAAVRLAWIVLVAFLSGLVLHWLQVIHLW